LIQSNTDNMMDQRW